jgi:hypothetical protein
MAFFFFSESLWLSKCAKLANLIKKSAGKKARTQHYSIQSDSTSPHSGSEDIHPCSAYAAARSGSIRRARVMYSLRTAGVAGNLALRRGTVFCGPGQAGGGIAARRTGGRAKGPVCGPLLSRPLPASQGCTTVLWFSLLSTSRPRPGGGEAWG